MGVVRMLDKSVYELIAAGEVIERPSSVIKELVENSIDAGATNITVEIKNGGRTYIRITDNGMGIAPEDIPLAFMRHATSKIRYKEDLTDICTLGFRGEALASICAVAKVDLITKCRPDRLGIHYVIEGGEEICYEDSGCPDGTTITVRDLFFNVPARLKFLKKDVSEGNSVANVVSKLALSHPEVSFKFIRDNKSELVTPGDGKLISAIYSVMGREFHGSVIPVDYSLNGVTVRGYVTKPLMSKANRAFQNFFVNARYVKSVTCMVALEEAYRDCIMTGKFPGCVLMLELSPSIIDVNVHPAKLEIRFSDEKPVYDAVYFSVKNSLMTLDTPMEAELTAKELPVKKPITFSEIKLQNTHIDTIIDFSASPPVLKENSRVNPQSNETETAVEEKIEAKAKYKYITKDKIPPVPQEFVDFICRSPEPLKVDDSPEKPEVTVLGEIFKTYIVAQRGDDMFLIDKHAAHERYNYDRLKAGKLQVESQIVLKAFKVRLSYEAHTAAANNFDMLKRFGFCLDIGDPPEVTVYGVPILLDDEDPVDLLTRITDSLAEGRKSGGSEVYDELYHSIACKGAIKGNTFTSNDELKYLAELVIDEKIRYCPHGRPTMIKFSRYEIEKLFKRKI